MMPVALWILYPYLLESVIRIVHGLRCRILWATSKPRLGPEHRMDAGVLIASFNVAFEVAVEQLQPFRTPLPLPFQLILIAFFEKSNFVNSKFN